MSHAYDHFHPSTTEVEYHYFPFVTMGFSHFRAGFLAMYFESFLHALNGDVRWPPHLEVVDFFVELKGLFQEYCVDGALLEEADGVSSQELEDMFWITFTYLIVDNWHDCFGCAKERDPEFKEDAVKLTWDSDAPYSYIRTSIPYRYWKPIDSLPEFWEPDDYSY